MIFSSWSWTIKSAVCAFQIFGIAARNQWCFSFMEALTWRARGTCLMGASSQPMEMSSWSPWTIDSAFSVSWPHSLDTYLQLLMYVSRHCYINYNVLVHICVPLSEVAFKLISQGIWISNLPTSCGEHCQNDLWGSDRPQPLTSGDYSDADILHQREHGRRREQVARAGQRGTNGENLRGCRQSHTDAKRETLFLSTSHIENKNPDLISIDSTWNRMEIEIYPFVVFNNCKTLFRSGGRSLLYF